jgi:hypothetical protein
LRGGSQRNAAGVFQNGCDCQSSFPESQRVGSHGRQGVVYFATEGVVVVKAAEVGMMQ